MLFQIPIHKKYLSILLTNQKPSVLSFTQKIKNAVANSGYKNSCFTIKNSLKTLPPHLQYFRYCSNFKMYLDKKIYEESYSFLFSSQCLLCRKIVDSVNHWVSAGM